MPHSRLDLSCQHNSNCTDPVSLHKQPTIRPSWDSALVLDQWCRLLTTERLEKCMAILDLGQRCSSPWEWPEKESKGAPECLGVDEHPYPESNCFGLKVCTMCCGFIWRMITCHVLGFIPWPGCKIMTNPGPLMWKAEDLFNVMSSIGFWFVVSAVTLVWVLCLSLVFYKERFGRAVEEEGEFARIRVCKQETLDMEEEYPSWAALAPSYLSRS